MGDEPKVETWVTLRVDVRTNDGRGDSTGRVEAEVRRALEERFGSVVIERWSPPTDPRGALDRLETARSE